MMSPQETHSLIRDIYSVDGSVAANEKILDRLVSGLGARHAILGHFDRVKGQRWDANSQLMRHMQEEQPQAWSAHFQRHSYIYQTGGPRAVLLGEGALFLPQDLFTNPDEQQLCRAWLDEVQELLGYSKNYLGGAFGTDTRVNGFLGMGFDNDATERTVAVKQTQPYWLMHLAAASKLHQRFDQARIAEMILDRLSFGLLVLDAAGRVTFVNTAAWAILDKQAEVSVQHGRFLAPEALLKAVSACKAEAAQTPDTRRTHTEVLFDSEGRPDCVLYATAFCDTGRVVSDEPLGTLLFLHDPADKPDRAVATASEMFQLTAAERDCLSLLLQGASRAQIAEVRSTSPETAKTQIKQVHQKLSCHKTSDLIARVMLFDPPVADR